MEPGDVAVISLGNSGDSDPYAQFDKIEERLDKNKANLTEGIPRVKPRKQKKSVAIDSDRADLEVRYLPPGNMIDYFDQFKLACPEEKISFSTFWRTWYSSFNHMKFRGQSSHSICSVCVRHDVDPRNVSLCKCARKTKDPLHEASQGSIC